ncbi:MAG TPA: alpha/beta hydrolase [Chitinophagaceae bacterium]|nr:alpha/beta hydrolase [Chitinophagaceae bacterium]
MKSIKAFLIAILCAAGHFTQAQKILKEQRNWSIYHTMGGSQTINSVQLSTGVQLEYAEQGDEQGTPVIFLHGYSDSWHSFEDILPYLPETIHAFALTQRGHGNSSKPEGNYHPKDLAADVAAFIKEMGLSKAVIVGHSLGGVVAQQFALDYPEQTIAIVLIGTDAAFRDNPGLAEFRQEVMKLADPIDYAFAERFQKSTIVRPIDSSRLKLFIDESLKMPARIWKEVNDGFMSVDYTKALHKINQPVLIFWGDKDQICPESSQHAMVKEIKNSKLIIYPGTGHALHWEQPLLFVEDFVPFVQSIR